MAKAKLERRRFLAGSAGLAGAAALLFCMGDPTPANAAPARPSKPDAPTTIRIASVPTAVEGNLLPTLIREFEKVSAYRVELQTTPDLYNAARAGKLDLAVSHYGPRDAEPFVMDGLGEIPRMEISKQKAL